MSVGTRRRLILAAIATLLAVWVIVGALDGRRRSINYALRQLDSLHRFGCAAPSPVATRLGSDHRFFADGCQLPDPRAS